jgi:Cu+-exporting ATPase
MQLTDVVALDPNGSRSGGMRAGGNRTDGSGTASDGGVTLESDAENRPTETEEFVLSAAASAEQGSEHPLAEAIVAGARERGVTVEEPESFENVPGHGVRATTSHGEVLVGNRKLVAEAGIDPEPAEETMERLEREGKTAMIVAVDERLVGVVADADEVKSSAREAVSDLRERGLDVLMLTGDNERTARAVAEEVGIDPANVRAEVLPDEKASAVEEVQRDGRRAMMVGDGVNDAPALAAAAVGTAIGSGTDVAIEAADVTLMRDDPRDVVKAIRISEGTLAKIKQNLFWALGYNTAMIPLASLGLLQPALAAGAMAFSSVSVLSNSLLFRRYTPDHDYRLLGKRR